MRLHGTRLQARKTEGDETPQDEVVWDETPRDETTGDKTEGDETPRDEIGSDETPRDESTGDKTAEDETPSDEIACDERASEAKQMSAGNDVIAGEWEGGEGGGQWGRGGAMETREVPGAARPALHSVVKIRIGHSRSRK